MDRFKITLIIIFLFPCVLFAQEFISFEEEKRIKFSDDCYWAESSDFSLEQATIQAMDYLVEKVISAAVYQTVERNEILKELELKVHKDRIKQEGKAHVIAWIEKDSVFVIVQKPLQSDSGQRDQVTPQQKDNDKFVKNTNSDLDPAIDALMGCKNYKDVNRVTRQYGFIRGEINNSNGFDHPENCIIAVFSSDYTLVALLDKGSSTRIDLLTGQVVGNPDAIYNKDEGYKLWYFQQ